jgi:hypothetical protein
MGQIDQQKTASKNGGRRTQKPSTARFNDAVFINYELDAVQQKACKAQDVTESDVFAKMQELIDDGYNFTFKFDGYSKSYACFMRQTGDDGPNRCFILTGRGSSPYKCCKQLLFKHYVCLNGEWGEYAERRGIDTIDD